jgi:hypothetical protein
MRTEKPKTKSKRRGNLAEFFAASPLRGSGIDLERLDDELRPVDFGIEPEQKAKTRKSQTSAAKKRD